MGELDLDLEIGDRAQATDDERRAVRVAEVDCQAVERRHLHAARDGSVEGRVERRAEDRGPLIGR